MTIQRHHFCLLYCLFFTSLAQAEEPKFTAEQLNFFEKNVRPLLIDNCYECHGAEEQEASLRLDSRQSILKGGDTGPAVVPGKVDEGELLQALKFDPDGYQMPPDGKLPQAKIDLIKKWVAMGAPWPVEEAVASAATEEFDLQKRAEHWSFQPLVSIKPPECAEPTWCRNEIDRFVLKKLREHQLTPADETSRRTWIRRVYLDTTGLPPSPQVVDQFVADENKNAYEVVIDRLLSSPRFGERWGRHWLDVVRYAESRGHEFDHNVANARQYRDYVIRALNADLPFDQFVIEHIAGDLLTEQTSHPRRTNPANGANESILGTGFWLLGEWVHSPVDIRQEEADRFDNMIDVYSKAFLGLTVACARCHDHKFDPIRQKDYYAIQGFLQSSSYQQARFETMLTNEPIAKRLNALDREASAPVANAIEELAQPTLAKLSDYLLAAHEVLRSIETKEQGTVFESFESGAYDGWTVTGDAFGSIPQTQQTIGKYQGNVGAVGRFFVNSHQIQNNGGGDKPTGTLTSPKFKIQQQFIHMRIGGGNHPGKTCVNLLIDGKVVLSATGPNSNQMSSVTWDVGDYQNDSAQIQVVDQVSGSWGNIGVDHIVFSGQQDSTSTLDLTLNETLIRQIAEKRSLVPSILKGWVGHFAESDQQRSPTAIWARFCKVDDPTAKEIKQLAQKTATPLASTIEAGSFQTSFSAEDLISTGPGFRLIPAEEQPLTTLTEDGNTRVVPVSSRSFIEWDSFWNQLVETSGNIKEPGATSGWKRGGRFLRTPTFEIQSGKIHCLVRGQVNTYAAVDSHILILGPLHKKLTKSHSRKDDWHLITHDLTGYEGHDAHLELIPAGDGDFAVQAIVQTADLAAVKRQFHEEINISGKIAADVLKVKEPTLSSVASVIQKRFASSESLKFINDHPQLFGIDSEEAQAKLKKVISPFQQRRKALIQELKFNSATAPCLLDGTSRDEYVFIRGNWKKKGETVPRRFLEVFGGESTANTGSGRLHLAEQMIDPVQTPILPRVIVNRIWHHYFGRGICPTTNDFGHLGQQPSHPELLDWLAQSLVDENWSLKSVHRKILLSSTYRMSSQVNTDPHVVEVDPNNMLLHRMNVKRLEGEAIRDAILTVSGRLNTEMFGPSVPIHLTDFLEGRGRPSQSGPIDGNGRRSIYLSVRRNFQEPFFQAFDFPTPHSSIGRRNVSNVPSQALALMNNPMVVEQSQKWAQRLLEEQPKASVEERIQTLFQQAFSRLPTAQEVELGKQFIAAQVEELGATENDLPVWIDYCHVLLNSKEFIFVN